eukprot:376692_1
MPNKIVPGDSLPVNKKVIIQFQGAKDANKYLFCKGQTNVYMSNGIGDSALFIVHLRTNGCAFESVYLKKNNVAPRYLAIRHKGGGFVIHCNGNKSDDATEFALRYDSDKKLYHALYSTKFDGQALGGGKYGLIVCQENDTEHQLDIWQMN